ncbi:MAG: hypothetical protein JSV62_02320 [Promethearchaeota archaeon]|nr:MAG: hypothetical protein JSV62_02320 [Candidatus Lokiarchaeota archaeon]
MSSKSLDKKQKEIQIINLEEPLRLRNFIIPFSKFSNPEKYIYYGYEKIPFHERHPIYQVILRNEFVKNLEP